MNKITYKTYLNDRLKEVRFHDKVTYPLYVQITHERKTIFFKSYYFELFSQPRYFLIVPGAGTRAPEMEEVIAKEKEVIDFIIAKHQDDFSLELFKTAYRYYSKDLCDITERGFMDYLFTYFWDKGNPIMGDLVKWGGSHIMAYNLVRDFKRMFNKPLYDELIENSFYYSPPYLPLYGFVDQNKRWPDKTLTVMEWEKPETEEAFRAYVKLHYPNFEIEEVMKQVNKYCIR